MLGRALDLDLPPRERILLLNPVAGREEVLIHSGAKQLVRVWPLDRYRRLAAQLRDKARRSELSGFWINAVDYDAVRFLICIP